VSVHREVRARVQKWRLKEGDEDKVDTIQLTSYKLLPLQVHLTERKEMNKCVGIIGFNPCKILNNFQ
jgi:hypothetical protein